MSKTGVAVVTGGVVLPWRTQDHCATIQTELVTIQRALKHARHRQGEVVVINTDSKSALQVLQQPRPREDSAGPTIIILGHLQCLAVQTRLVLQTGCPATWASGGTRRLRRLPGRPPGRLLYPAWSCQHAAGWHGTRPETSPSSGTASGRGSRCERAGMAAPPPASRSAQ